MIRVRKANFGFHASRWPSMLLPSFFSCGTCAFFLTAPLFGSLAASLVLNILDPSRHSCNHSHAGSCHNLSRCHSDTSSFGR